MKYTMDLKKAAPMETKDGELTSLGMRAAQAYARAWVGGKRNLDMEREHPELAGTFYDIRIDWELAKYHAMDFETGKGSPVQKSLYTIPVRD